MKQKLKNTIQKLKNRGELTKQELDIMFNCDYELEELFWRSEKTIKEIKAHAGISVQTWLVVYRHNYGKLKITTINKLAEALELPIDELLEVLKRDIKKQKRG